MTRQTLGKLTLFLLYALLTFISCSDRAVSQNLSPEILDGLKQRTAKWGVVRIAFSGAAKDLSCAVFIAPSGVMCERVSKQNGITTRTVRNLDYAFEVKKKDGKYFLSGARRPQQKETNFEKLLDADLEIVLPEMYPFGLSIFQYADPAMFEKVSEEKTEESLTLTLKCTTETHEFLKSGGLYTFAFDRSKGNLLREAKLSRSP